MKKKGTLVREDFSKPPGEPSPSSSRDNKSRMYMLYFKGLIREEATGLLAGYGFAITDQEDNILFQMKGPLHGSGITVLEAELRALKRGLTEAVGLGINHISIYCDYKPVFDLIMGRSPPDQDKITLLMDDVQRIRQQLTSSIPILMTGNQTMFAYKLALETVVSNISIRMPPTQKKTCLICLDDDFEDDQMFSVALCGHQFCMDCMKQYIEVSLLEGSVLRCPRYQCKTKLIPRSCANLLTTKQGEMWERRIVEESVPVADRVYCPNPKCSALMSEARLFKSGEQHGSMRCCFNCGEPFCINCKVPWHSNLMCDDYKRLHPNPTGNDGKFIALSNKEKWRQCERCKHMVELSEGCIHITCRCGYSFCYKCGNEWKVGGCPHQKWVVLEGRDVLYIVFVFCLVFWSLNQLHKKYIRGLNSL